MTRQGFAVSVRFWNCCAIAVRRTPFMRAKLLCAHPHSLRSGGCGSNLRHEPRSGQGGTTPIFGPHYFLARRGRGDPSTRTRSEDSRFGWYPPGRRGAGPPSIDPLPPARPDGARPRRAGRALIATHSPETARRVPTVDPTLRPVLLRFSRFGECETDETRTCDSATLPTAEFHAPPA